MNIKIVSGGQTGVGQGALEAAVRLGMSPELYGEVSADIVSSVNAALTISC